MKPKFKVTDTVTMIKPDLNGDYIGEVTEVSRIFKECYPGTTEIDPDGLTMIEDHLDTMCVPWEIKDNILTVTSDGKNRTHIFDGYVVTIYTGKMSTLINEKYVM